MADELCRSHLAIFAGICEFAGSASSAWLVAQINWLAWAYSLEFRFVISWHLSLTQACTATSVDLTT